MTKLYTKSQRRYSEATRGEILREAASILREIDDTMASEILGVSIAVSMFDARYTTAKAHAIEKAQAEQKKIDKAVQ